MAATLGVLASISGLTAVFFPPSAPVTGPLAAGLGSVAAGDKAMAVVAKKLKIDPPDCNFREIASPVSPRALTVAENPGVPAGVTGALNRWWANIAEIQGAADALATAMNRAQCAQQSGDAEWQVAQQHAAGMYAVRTAELVDADPPLRRDIAQSYQAAGIRFSLTIEQARGIQQQIAKQGLPDQMVRDLRTSGASDELIAALQTAMTEQSVPAFAFPELLNDSEFTDSEMQAAQSLREFGGSLSAAQAPARFPVTYMWLGALILLLLGTVGVLAMRRRARRADIESAAQTSNGP